MVWINLWFIVVVFQALILEGNLFKIKSNGIYVSIWGKSFLINGLCLISYVILSAYFKDRIVGENDFSFIAVLCLLYLYIPYVTFMFRYEYNSERFIWFNGLWLKSIVLKDLVKVILIKKDNRITKICFLLKNGQIRMKNDFGIENMVKSFIKKSSVPIIERHL